MDAAGFAAVRGGCVDRRARREGRRVGRKGRPCGGCVTTRPARTPSRSPCSSRTQSPGGVEHRIRPVRGGHLDLGVADERIHEERFLGRTASGCSSSMSTAGCASSIKAAAGSSAGSGSITDLTGSGGAGRLRISLARWEQGHDFIGKCGGIGPDRHGAPSAFCGIRILTACLFRLRRSGTAESSSSAGARRLRAIRSRPHERVFIPWRQKRAQENQVRHLACDRVDRPFGRCPQSPARRRSGATCRAAPAPCAVSASNDEDDAHERILIINTANAVAATRKREEVNVVVRVNRPGMRIPS
jgi:hypothetical protein